MPIPFLLLGVAAGHLFPQAQAAGFGVALGRLQLRLVPGHLQAPIHSAGEALLHKLDADYASGMNERAE